MLHQLVPEPGLTGPVNNLDVDERTYETREVVTRAKFETFAAVDEVLRFNFQ